ncbi:hypothetical protein VXN63_01750 [Marinilactibacillus sp. XAAS-LB27]|uniref:hypothetical protein n=1 Tax=Marinilactibacillus sp. XAAS-LB27 TaxID=3114538 RepID=UPI002E182DD1|nr:hypothetical protein [Marinilactibacillus sp. XAAS-LB27]
MFTLGRKIHLDDKTNISIVLFTLSAFALGWLFSGDVGSGFNLGGGVFLTWALTREIDPAHSYSAFIAAALSLFHIVYMDTPHFLVMAWMLLLLRAVNGITGKKLTLFDIFSALALTTYLSFSNENSLFLLVFSLALIGIFMFQKRKKVVFICGTIALILFLIKSLFLGHYSVIDADQMNPLNILVIISSIFFSILAKFDLKDEVKSDNGKKADRTRIFYGQLLYSITTVLFIFFGHLTSSDLFIQLSAICGVFINYCATKVVDYYKRFSN